MLLLEEPGLSPHPLAQRDLSAFFDKISKTHHIAHTAHSPFPVDADRLDRARKALTDKDGLTRVTSDLCASERGGGQGGAAYAVARRSTWRLPGPASGRGPVLVPGMVEKIYLSLMKTLLVAAGEFTLARDTIFAPAGNPDVVRRMTEPLTRSNQKPRMVLCDGTFAGSSDLQVSRRNALPTWSAGPVQQSKT